VKCARCRTFSVEGELALCYSCYQEFSFVSLDPADVKVWYAIRDLLSIKDNGVLKDVADSAGGTEAASVLMEEKDYDTKYQWLKKEIAKL
jgi:hypothetical protein